MKTDNAFNDEEKFRVIHNKGSYAEGPLKNVTRTPCPKLGIQEIYLSL